MSDEFQELRDLVESKFVPQSVGNLLAAYDQLKRERDALIEKCVHQVCGMFWHHVGWLTPFPTREAAVEALLKDITPPEDST